jgi:hypothetical protein
MAMTMGVAGGIATAGAEKPAFDLEKVASVVHPNTPGIYHRENWGLAARVDPTVTFEEYIHWAKVERALEIEADKKYRAKRGPWSFLSLFKDRFSKGIHHQEQQEAIAAATEAEKNGAVTAGSDGDFGPMYEEEWRIAARALRTAGWGTVFYLITTDILGWGSTP